MNLKKLAAGTVISTALLLASGAGLAFAQTTGTTGTTGTTYGTTGTSGTTGTTGTSGSTNGAGTTATPGTPNTGAGGDAMTTLLMLGATVVFGGGAALYLARARQQA